MFGSTIALALLLLGAATSTSGSSLADVTNLRGFSASTGPACDESFPLAPPPPAFKSNNGNGRRRRLVAIPPGDTVSGEYYETGEYYAPLCPDGRRIDIRELGRCVGDSCYDEAIGFCTFVCHWNGDPKPEQIIPGTPTSRPTTSKPTSTPTSAPEVTEHHLLMDLSRLPRRYRMDEEVRAAIIRYLKGKISNDLEELGVGLELLDVVYPGRLDKRPHSLPLEVTVKGPSDVSDFALATLLRALRDADEEIATFIKRLDGGGSGDSAGDLTTFQNVALAFSTYDPADIINWMSMYPTESPTSPPIEAQGLEEGINTLDVDTVDNFPWWAWLIIVLVVLLMCCCCCYCFRYRRNNNNKRNKDISSNKVSSSNKEPMEQAVKIFMQNRMVQRKDRRPTGRERERSKGSRSVTRRSRGAPRSVVANARVRHHNDDQTKRSRQTRGTHMAHAVPTAVSVTSEDTDTLFSIPEIFPQTKARTHLPIAYDDETAVSAISHTYDAPEEANAMVIYNPTFYTNRATIPEQVEPEGDKIMKKQSVFVTSAMMNEVHRERKREEEASRKSAASRRRSDPRGSMGRRMNKSLRQKNKAIDPLSETEHDDDEGRYKDEPPSETWGFQSEPNIERYGHRNVARHSNLLSSSEPEGLTYVEMIAEKVNDNKKKSGRKKKKSRKPADASGVSPYKQQRKMDRPEKLYDSFSRAPQNLSEQTVDHHDCYPTINIDFEANDPGYDSPSVLTNHDNDSREEDSFQTTSPPDGDHRNRNESKPNGTGDISLFPSIRHQSSDFDRDAISSADSFLANVDQERGYPRHQNNYLDSSAGII